MGASSVTSSSELDSYRAGAAKNAWPRSLWLRVVGDHWPILVMLEL